MAPTHNPQLWRLTFRGRLRPIAIGSLVLLVVTQRVCFSPGVLEKTPQQRVVNRKPLNPEDLVEDLHGEGPVVEGIPENEVPDYSVQDMDFITAEAGKKKWRLKTRVSHFFNHLSIVHGRDASADLFDEDSKPTHVTGNEAKFKTDVKNLQIFGNVVTRFHDGFTLHSEVMQYLPDQNRVLVPIDTLVKGKGDIDPTKNLEFTSNGLDFNRSTNIIFLEKNVQFKILQKKDPPETIILADHCQIDRANRIATFTMKPDRPQSEQFVYMDQPKLKVRSRRMEIHYGSQGNKVDYLTAYEDVLIREIEKGKVDRRATGGRADFDSKENTIVLTQFPQVYQGNDTITGFRVTIHRDTDIVDVEDSNAFTEGTRQE